MKDFKRITIISCFFILASILFCGNKKENGSGTNDETRQIKDMLGNTLTIPKNLTRVALFGGPTGQIAYLLGVQDRLCAVTTSLKLSKLVREMDPKIKNIPGARSTSGSVNIEELILSNPQLVIAGSLDAQIVERKTDIPVAWLDTDMVEGYNAIRREVKFFGRVFDRNDRAESFIKYLDDMIKKVKSRVDDIPDSKKKLIFNGYQKNHLVTIGGGSFLQEFIETAGCKNAAEDVSTLGKREGLHSGLGEVSMEQVIAWNPDIIIINMHNTSDIYNNSRWKRIKAVQNKQIFKQPAGIFILDRPTAESAFIYTLWLAVIAYPQKFRDINLVEEIKNFYKYNFNFKLSTSQAQNILNSSYTEAMTKGFKF